MDEAIEKELAMTTAVRATSTKPLLREFGEAKRDSLIPILQKAQEVHGYLSEEAIARSAVI